MVSVLKVSESTVKRILCKYEIYIYSQYPNLSEAELDAMVMDIIQQVPKSGYKSMRKVDPERVIERSVSP